MLEVLLRRHRPDNEALSALLDGQLTGRQLDAVQAHVTSCAACRERLEALRRTRDTLRTLPDVDAPRSFRLRSADVPASAPVRRAPAAMRAMPLVGAAAALVFIVVLEADLARGGTSTSSNQTSGLQAMSAGTRGAATSTGAAVGQIGAADGAAPTTANAARENPSTNPIVTPPGTAFDASAGAGAPPAPEAATPGAPSAGAPVPPEALGSPQPALGTESGVMAPAPSTPSNGPAPIAPTVPTQPPPEAKSAVTQPAPTPADARQVLAPTSSSAESDASHSSGESSGRSDVTYRIAEAVAAATALAAIAASVAWRMKNRKVGP